MINNIELNPDARAFPTPAMNPGEIRSLAPRRLARRSCILLALLLVTMFRPIAVGQEPAGESSWFSNLLAWMRHEPTNTRIEWRLKTTDWRPPKNIDEIAKAAVKEDELSDIMTDRIVNEYACEWYWAKNIEEHIRSGFCHFGDDGVRVVRELSEGIISDPGPDLEGAKPLFDRLVAKTSGEFISVARSTYIFPDGSKRGGRISASRTLLSDVSRASELDVFPLLAQKEQLDVAFFEMSPIDVETLAKTGTYQWPISRMSGFPHAIWIPSRTLIQQGAVSVTRTDQELNLTLSLSRRNGTTLSRVTWSFEIINDGLALTGYTASIFLPNGSPRRERTLTIQRRDDLPLLDSAISFDNLVPDGTKVRDERYDPAIEYSKFAGMTDADVVKSALSSDATLRKEQISDGISPVAGPRRTASSEGHPLEPESTGHWSLVYVLGGAAGLLLICFLVLRRRRIRQVAVWVLALGILGGCRESVTKQSPVASPCVSLARPGESIDLGNFLWGGAGDTHIDLRNDSDVAEIVEGVYTDCSCLTAQLEPCVIPPRGSVAVMLHVSTSVPGESAADLTLRRGDGSEIRLGTAHFNIMWGLRPPESILDWQDVREVERDGVASGRPFVFNLLQDGIRVDSITRVSLRAPLVVAEVTKLGTGQWRVEFAPEAPLPIGSFWSAVDVQFYWKGVASQLHLPIRITSSLSGSPRGHPLPDIVVGLVPTAETRSVIRRLTPEESEARITDVRPLHADVEDAPTCEIVHDESSVRVRVVGRNKRKKMGDWTFVATMAFDRPSMILQKVFRVLAAY